MLRIAICDDELIHRETIEELIRKYAQMNHIDFSISLFSSGFLLLDSSKKFDIYLLDILMPGMTGITIANELRMTNTIASIVFLTSSPEFALEGYSVHADGYLIKPLSEEKLFEVLDHVLSHRKGLEQNELLIQCNGTIQSLSLDSIEYIEARQDKLIFYLCNGSTCIGTGTLSAIEERLSSDPRFFKPHRSYLVNMTYIQELNGKEIHTSPCFLPVPIARGHFASLKKTYLSYMTFAMKKGESS